MRNEGTTNSIPAHQARPTRGTRAITTRISHIIYLGHFLRCAKNVAIPTMQVQYLNKTKGNYVRNCSAHPKPRPRSGPPPTDTASNPAHTCRKIATKPTRFVHPPSWLPPPLTPTFPHQQAEKSLQDQHVLSILQVGSHQLQYRFFRTNKPKSRHKTHTFCPLTPNPHRRYSRKARPHTVDTRRGRP